MDDIVENPPVPTAPGTAAPAENSFNLQSRHYDMALAEQAVHRARGRHLSVEEILKRNGFRHGEERSGEQRSKAGHAPHRS